MKGFGACVQAELGDLLRHPLAWLAALATAITAVVVGLSPTTDSRNAWLVYEAALSASSQAAGFFLLGIAAGSVASDRTRGTVRWIMPRPIARSGYVFGKSAAILLFAILLLAIATVTSLIVAAPNGFDDVTAMSSADEEPGGGFDFVEDETVPPEFKADAMRGYAIGVTGRLLPALWALAAIGILVSSVMRSAAGAVIAAIGCALPLHFLPELIGLSADRARMLPQRAATDAFSQFAEYGQRHAGEPWHEYNAGAGVGALMLCFGLPLLAALIFKRLDLTD